MQLLFKFGETKMKTRETGSLEVFVRKRSLEFAEALRLWREEFIVLLIN